MGTRLCKEWKNNFPTQLQFTVCVAYILGRISSMICVQGCDTGLHTHVSGIHNVSSVVYDTSVTSHLYQIRYDSRVMTPGCIAKYQLFY